MLETYIKQFVIYLIIAERLFLSAIIVILCAIGYLLNQKQHAIQAHSYTIRLRAMVTLCNIVVVDTHIAATYQG